jgi:hypothetical protein
MDQFLVPLDNPLLSYFFILFIISSQTIFFTSHNVVDCVSLPSNHIKKRVFSLLQLALLCPSPTHHPIEIYQLETAPILYTSAVAGQQQHLSIKDSLYLVHTLPFRI